MIASGSSDKLIMLWHVNNGFLRTFSGHSDIVFF
jgi:WD40 repeat protein